MSWAALFYTTAIIHYDQKNILSEKLSSGKILSGNSPVDEVSLGGVSIREVSFTVLSTEKCYSGNCPIRKLSYNQ